MTESIRATYNDYTYIAHNGVDFDITPSSTEKIEITDHMKQKTYAGIY